MYLPLEPVPFDQRRFALLKTRDDPIEQLVDAFGSFLGKDSLLSRNAERSAKRALQAKREADLLNAEIPGVWNRMLKKPDAELLELLGRRVYEKVNLRPSKEQVAAVLRDSPRPTVAVPDPGTPRHKPDPPAVPETGSPGRPSSVRLWGEQYDVKHWRDSMAVLRRVAEVLHQQHGADFEKRVLAYRTSTRNPIASRNRDDLRSPIPLGLTDIFLETDLNKTQMLSRASFLLKSFRHGSSDLEILYD